MIFFGVAAFEVMHYWTRRFALALAFSLVAFSSAFAQVPPGWETKQYALERIDADRIRLVGEVEVIGVGPNAGQQIFAEDLEWNTRTGELIASGNVLLVSATGRISAERVVFNTKSRLGTFYTASGIASLGERAAQDKSMFGSLEPEVYFYGKTIEKIGDDRYRITGGGFTTCVQPTPRWDLVSGSVTIDLEDYAVLRHAVLRVKDVPLLYLPILYYPIQSDGRSTGFLLPTYGNSTYRGQSISNAFFWAVNRSQDATFFHDLLFTRGQGAGAEYRYVSGPASQGQVRFYRLVEKDSAIATRAGSITIPARNSYELMGVAAQKLPGGLVARAGVNYFSNLAVRQLYQSDFSRAADSNRQWNASLAGNWGGFALNTTYMRSQYFYAADYYNVSGRLPTVAGTMSSRQLGRWPVFAALQGEFGRIEQKSVTARRVDDFNLWRGDFMPSLRATLSSLPYLGVNTTASWSYTRYSGQLDNNGLFVDESLTRRFYDLRADISGPILTRVFEPGARWADRLKHVIQPAFTTSYRSKTPPLRNIAVATNYGDYIVGDTTQLTYGLVTQLLVKAAPALGPDGTVKTPQSRELLTVTLQQSYYSQPEASPFDPSYSISYIFRRPQKYSPVLLAVRGRATDQVTGEFRMEYETATGQQKIAGLSLSGGVETTRLSATAGWSQRSFTYGEAFAPDNYFRSSTRVQTRSGSIGGTFNFTFDLRRQNMVHQTWIGHYNAQCCGIAFEYQAYNYPGFDPRFPIPTDRRFNMSFTLAGLGSFSNLFGSFGGSRY